MSTALAAAHEAGIIHRDIKPENVMLRRDGYVKVLDFGLAKLTENSPPAPESEALTVPMATTDPGVVMGTPKYMSPEQARGFSLDVRTDVWSTGCVLYEMIAGRAPFEGGTISDTVVSILEREPPPLTLLSPAAPPELEQIANRALSKDRDERYQTIEEFALDLQSLRQKLQFEAELERSLDPSLRGAAALVTRSGVPQLNRTVKDFAAVPAKSSGAKQERERASAATPRTRRPSRKSINSLAVLPFANASADAQAEYLSDGITESITSSLSQMRGLRVMASSTVFRYKGREADPQTLGMELGVRAVLTGRIIQLGDTLIVRTELVDVADGAQLWGDQYNRKLADILTVQGEIASQISETLRMKLTGEEKKRLAKRSTENPEAYQLYLKGRYHWNKRTVEGFTKAVEYFNAAIVIDPSYALAFAGLADCYALLGSDEYGALAARDAMPKAKAAAEKALELDETLAEAHASLAYVTWVYDWDQAAAEREFKRAIELNPNYATARHWYAISYLSALGRHREALAEIKRAQELDPLSLIINSAVAWVFYFAREHDRAIEQYRKTLELDPHFSVARTKLAWAYEQKSMYREAIAELREAIRVSGGRVGTASLGHTLAASGREEETRQVLDELKERAEWDHVPPYNIALIYVALGENDQAIEWLRKARAERSSWLVWLGVDPRFDRLHGDERFVDLLPSAGLAGSWDADPALAP